MERFTTLPLSYKLLAEEERQMRLSWGEYDGKKT